MNEYFTEIIEVTYDKLTTRSKWVDIKSGSYKNAAEWVKVSEPIKFAAEDPEHAITKLQYIVRDKYPGHSAYLHTELERLDTDTIENSGD